MEEEGAVESSEESGGQKGSARFGRDGAARCTLQLAPCSAAAGRHGDQPRWIDNQRVDSRASVAEAASSSEGPPAAKVRAMEAKSATVEAESRQVEPRDVREAALRARYLWIGTSSEEEGEAEDDSVESPQTG